MPSPPHSLSWWSLGRLHYVLLHQHFRNAEGTVPSPQQWKGPGKKESPGSPWPQALGGWGSGDVSLGIATGEPGASGGNSHKPRDDDVRECPWTRCPSRDTCLWALWTREGAGTGRAGTGVAQGCTPWPLCGGAGVVRGGSGEFGKSVETSRMPVLEEGGPGRAVQTDSCPQIHILWSHCGSSSEMGSL